MSLPAAKLFVRVRAPYPLLPRGSRRIAARIAKDLITFLEGFTSRYNELHGLSLDPAQGLIALLDAKIDPSVLFSEYRVLAEQARPALSAWTVTDGFKEGYKWMTPEFTDWFIQVIVPKPCRIDQWTSYAGAPWLTKVLTEHEGGREWIRGFVAELRQFLYPNIPTSATAFTPKTMLEGDNIY